MNQKRSRTKRISREAQVLKEFRLRRKLSIRKAALAIKISPTTVNHMENGRAEISQPYVEKFLQALNYSTEEWLQHTGQEIFLEQFERRCLELLAALTNDKRKLVYELLLSLN